MNESNVREVQDVGPRPSDVGCTPIDQVPDFPESEPLAGEWQTFKREVNRMIKEGNKGRFAVIKRDKVISIWDTLRDALHGGNLQLGQEPFMVQEIQLFVRPFRTRYFR